VSCRAGVNIWTWTRRGLLCVVYHHRPNTSVCFCCCSTSNGWSSFCHLQQMCGLNSLWAGGQPINYSDEKTMGVIVAFEKYHMS